MRPSTAGCNERSRRTVTAATAAGGAALGRRATDRGNHTASTAATESVPSCTFPSTFGNHIAVVAVTPSTVPLFLTASPTLRLRGDYIGFMMVVMVVVW